MLVNTVKEVKEIIRLQRTQNHTIGFVPTMGFLHEGHLSLIKRAKEENDFVVVSVFVNPTQFGPQEDYESYPRNIERDYQLAMQANADLVFYPEAEEIYPPNASTFVEVEGELVEKCCGRSRPAHFKGVTTVVNKLFHIVRPDHAYFGQKDAQQYAVIQKMVRDLHMDVKVVVCPIVREEDGLAMSSRNTYLSKEERKQALVLSAALIKGKQAYNQGINKVSALKKILEEKILESPLADIDYVEILDMKEMGSIEYVKEKAIALVAVRFGKTRLIDNMIIGEGETRCI